MVEYCPVCGLPLYRDLCLLGCTRRTNPVEPEPGAIEDELEVAEEEEVEVSEPALTWAELCHA